MIGGFEEPDEGAIYLGDDDVVGLPPYRRDVNTVFQSYALFPHLSIFDNVAFGLRRKGVDKTAGEGPGRGDAAPGRAHRPRRAPAAPALRWTAAARRAGPRPREPAAGAAARRAARRTRPEAAQADAAGAEGDPARSRAHVRPRHARSGRSDDDGRRDRSDEQGPDRAARAAERALREARDRVRRRVPRRLEPARTVPSRTPAASGSTRATRSRRTPTAAQAGLRRDPPGEDPHRPPGEGDEQPRRHRRGDGVRRRRHAVVSETAPAPSRSSMSRTTTPAGACSMPRVGRQLTWSPHATFVVDRAERRRKERDEPAYDPRRASRARRAAGAPSSPCPGLLAACGGGEGSDGCGERRGGEAHRTLHFSNWELYIDVDEKTTKRPTTLDQFTKETGISVNYFEEINANDGVLRDVQGPLRAGNGIDRDIIVSTDNDRYLGRLVDERLGREARQGRDPEHRRTCRRAQASPSFDPDRELLAAVAVGDGPGSPTTRTTSTPITSIDAAASRTRT